MSLAKFKLISFALCPYVQRARILLIEKNVPHEIEYIDLQSPPPWFYDISPLEKVPVLLVDDTPIFESMVICEYLDEVTPGSLHPTDPLEKAQHRAWIEFGSSILDTAYIFFSTKDKTIFKRKTAELEERFDTLEETLGSGPFFNSDNFSLIDAVYGPIFRYFDTINKFHDFGIFNDTPKVSAWADTLLAHPSVQQSVPADYTDQLEQYLLSRGSVLSATIRENTIIS